MSQTDWNQLRELACERRDTLGLRLAEAATVRDAARQKLEMLLDYRNEYDNRLAQNTNDGIDAEKLRSYRTFLAAQALWRGEQRQVESFRILDQRQQAEIARAAGRIEQKLTDELASRRLAAAAGVAD
jgi:flagellar protein FliJ